MADDQEPPDCFLVVRPGAATDYVSTKRPHSRLSVRTGRRTGGNKDNPVTLHGRVGPYNGRLRCSAGAGWTYSLHDLMETARDAPKEQQNLCAEEQELRHTVSKVFEAG